MGDFPPGVVPPGRYTHGYRSPIVHVHLCAGCAGYAPTTPLDYTGALSGQCQGCGARSRELHRFSAWIDSTIGCRCNTHAPVTGDLPAGSQGTDTPAGAT